RKLSNDSRLLADHTELLNEIADKTEILETIWYEVRSGEQAGFRNGTEMKIIAGASSFGNISIDPAKEGEKDKSQKITIPNNTFIPDFENYFVGLQFDTNPILGPDGKTIDLNVGLGYDYAPPKHIEMVANGAENEIVMDSPEIKFHRVRSNTQITSLTGAQRLLSIWKPTDKPGVGNKDIYQAAFVKVQIRPVDPPMVKD
ncbi:MAG: hypothetical protein AAF226_07395, partial [Verrucomicrobiota bacterium]